LCAGRAGEVAITTVPSHPRHSILLCDSAAIFALLTRNLWSYSLLPFSPVLTLHFVSVARSKHTHTAIHQCFNAAPSLPQVTQHRPLIKAFVICHSHSKYVRGQHPQQRCHSLLVHFFPPHTHHRLSNNYCPISFHVQLFQFLSTVQSPHSPHSI
jgi:hypothetical protein